MAALENQLSQEMEQIDQLRAAQAQAETRLQQLLKQVDIQQSANEQLNRSLAEHSRDRFQIAAERDELIKDRQSNDDQLAEEQSVAQQLRKDLESATNETTRLQAELQAKSEEASVINARYQKAHGLASALTSDASRLESKLQEASKKLAATEVAIAKLTDENASLASASQTQLDDVNRLEQSLEGMQTELEEQMAQVRNANKAKAQLQRKVDKLERKLKSMSDVPAAAEVPIPAAVLAPQPIVHNQEAIRSSPGALAGQKRVRDDDLAVKKVSAGPEAVIAPSPFEMARTPVKRIEAGTNRLAFTPTRHNLNPNLGAIPRSPYARLAAGDENSFPAMAMMRGRIGSVLNQHTPGP
ncbi:hypothetical protein FFLO_02302 [Filobasidium floriforme]|uniref:Uncharacterized protein n=1 Tax=Filobasidium floriforme TaxID=5210 RepID=A0A8K0NRD9_9TREE|nr:uncharacterized protein HD553DRAFT_316937 [Filobasidium floriforme]KAG7562216.1 hypothetical protein FFLO_02302 [Filobasidium floriforme]KAH8080519.1 hypothetical protein HD553DRAFT_316937 [Filobasidium floriforme]